MPSFDNIPIRVTRRQQSTLPFLRKGGSFILFKVLRIYKQERFAVKHQWGNNGGLRLTLEQALLSQASPGSDKIYQPSAKSSWRWIRKPWERQMGMNIPRHSHLTLKAGLGIHKTENKAKCKGIQGSPEHHLSFHLLQGTEWLASKKKRQRPCLMPPWGLIY